jgi:hypothetical protein
MSSCPLIEGILIVGAASRVHQASGYSPAVLRALLLVPFDLQVCNPRTWFPVQRYGRIGTCGLAMDHRHLREVPMMGQDSPIVLPASDSSSVPTSMYAMVPGESRASAAAARYGFPVGP